MATTPTKKPTLHHVNFKTNRMDEMIEWYGKVIGAEVTFRYDGGAWITNDEANHRIALLAVPGLEEDPRQLSHVGLHHTAYEYGSMDDLLDTYQRLRSEGIVPHACLDHGMTMSFYYVDPDGHSVELQYDEFGDWADSKRFMETADAFHADPIGVSVDPDLIAAARDEGADAAAIHERAYGGEFTPSEPLDLRLPPAAG